VFLTSNIFNWFLVFHGFTSQRWRILEEFSLTTGFGKSSSADIPERKIVDIFLYVSFTNHGGIIAYAPPY